MIDYIIAEGVSGYSLELNTNLIPFLTMEDSVESRTDDLQQPNRDGYFPAFDYTGRRLFTIEGNLQADNPQAYMALRRKLMSVFVPRSQYGFQSTVRLRVKFTGMDQEVYADCMLDGMPRLPRAALSPSRSEMFISLKANDPRYYSSDWQSAEFIINPGTQGRSYPKKYPLDYSLAGSGNSLQELNNHGNADGFILATFTGPMSAPMLKLIAEDQEWIWTATDLNILPNDFITVDFNKRTMRSSDGGNLNKLRDKGSSWFMIPPGISSLYFSAQTSSGSALVQWQDAHML